MIQFLTRIKSDLQILRSHPSWQDSPLKVISRMISWGWHTITGTAAIARFKHWGFDLYMPAKRRGGSTAPYLFREFYEPELLFLDKVVKPGMTIVDGGANTGVFGFAAARLTGKTGRVLCYEPGEEYFQAMVRSKELNDLPQLELYQDAIAEKTEKLRFYHHMERENAFGLANEGDENMEGVPYDELNGVALDDVLPEVDIIKLDIVGAEEFALKGSRRLLAESKPMVLLEIDPISVERLGLNPLGPAYILEEYGYDLYCLGNDLMLYKLGSYENVRHIIAIHPEQKPQDEANLIKEEVVTSVNRFMEY